ncbi:unnamed protein product [Caenorhabditis auriculariae]|uniref:C2H2-type domain-containing protein n=1 Tax=Caenorhabditis auriculariae TaxID=2777116 RepID=A0A8S1HR47_9PELO|nr:unnamed protein product [Caenorhabditis auriculariae]
MLTAGLCRVSSFLFAGFQRAEQDSRREAFGGVDRCFLMQSTIAMSIDAANGPQELFKQLSKGGALLGGGSPSSLASSGAPSSSSCANDANSAEDKNSAASDNANSWFNAFTMPRTNQRQPQMNDFIEQLGLQNVGSQSQIMDALGINGNFLNALASFSSQNEPESIEESTNQLLRMMNSKPESAELSQPKSSVPSSLASLLTPTTSSAAAATSSERTTPPTHASVIVNTPANQRESSAGTPPAKKHKNSEDSDFMKSAIDNLFRVQMTALNGAMPTPGEGTTNCDECGREFLNALAMLTHKAQEHTTAGEVAGEENGQIRCSECDKDFENVAYLEQHRITHHLSSQSATDFRIFNGLFPQSLGHLPFMLQSPIHQQFGLPPDLDSPLSALSTPKQGGAVKRQYSSNGKNYCDLCNKEVCNKYFLRTHMLKMHGIVIDENKTVIANIDTLERERMGSLSFRCDTCFNEFKSRQQLRQHKQDAHGVAPISTPSNRGSAPKSVPTTPNILSTNGSSNNLTSNLMEEKCHLCDKRVPAIMLPMHIQQDHMNALTTDLNQVMALFNQASRTPREPEERKSESERGVYRCGYCQYITKDLRNFEMHQERHERMNEAKRRSSDDDEDEVLKLTTEAALKMVAGNQMDNVDHPMDASQAVLNLSLHKVPELSKKESTNEEEKVVAHERNSHTSGSISPSGESLPEGFGKAIGTEKPYMVQSFVIRSNDEKGAFLGEFLAHLPVRNLVDGPRQVVFELHPAPSASM